MGMFDTYYNHRPKDINDESYISIQLKVGECMLDSFQEGDKVDIPDGFYIGWGGLACVKNGVLVSVSDHMNDSHGNYIEITNNLYKNIRTIV